MTTILAEMRIGNPTSNVGTSGTIRYYSSIDFTDTDGVKYKAGRLDSSDFFLTNTWSVSGGDLIVPAIADFPSTDDGQPGTARITAAIYSGTQRIGLLFENCIIPAYPSGPITLLYLETLKHLPMRVRDTTTLSKSDFAIMLQQAIEVAVGTLNDAGAYPAGPKGRVYLSTATPNSIAVGSSDSRVGMLTPQMYGAIADGSSHPLSSVYGTLSAAQAVYSFATSLTQEIDYCATQKCFYEALGYPTLENAFTNSRLNKPIYCPHGTYVFGADTLLIRNTVGMHWYGDSRFATTFVADGCVFQADGFWYSRVERIQWVSTTSTLATVDIDGNVPGHPYATRGVQGNTFIDCSTNGSLLASYSFILCRQGGNSAQGSENLFLNNHFNGATFACLAIFGSNAIQNTIIGGNLQTYTKHGIYILAGQADMISIGFQSTYGKEQIDNGGYDVYQAASSGFPSTMKGCRSESSLLAYGVGDIVDCGSGLGATSTWGAGTVYALSHTVAGIPGSNTTDGRVFICVQAGTSDVTEPDWSTLDLQSSYYDWGRSAAINLGSPTLTVLATNAGRVGQTIVIAGAGVAGVDFITTILAVVDSTHYTLAANASTTVTDALFHIGATLTDGTVKWIAFDYFIIDGFSSIRNVVMNYGKMRAGASATLIQSPLVGRADWLDRAAYDQDSVSGKFPIIINPQVRKGYTTQAAIQSPLFPLGAEAWNLYSFFSALNLAGNPLLFDTGENGNMYNSVGVTRGDGIFTTPGTVTDISRNVVGVIGTLGKVLTPGTDQNGTDQNIQPGLATGSGTPGVLNLRGGSTGASGTGVRNSVDGLRIDGNTTANETRFLVWDITAGSFRRVSIGAADSGGAGFRTLRIAN